MTNGAEALDALNSGTYAAILMDLPMPVLDGIETTKRIREIERKNNRHPIAVNFG